MLKIIVLFELFVLNTRQWAGRIYFSTAVNRTELKVLLPTFFFFLVCGMECSLK